MVLQAIDFIQMRTDYLALIWSRCFFAGNVAVNRNYFYILRYLNLMIANQEEVCRPGLAVHRWTIPQEDFLLKRCWS